MKTIKELFTDASKWIKGTSWAKRDGSYAPFEKAECFCLSGAAYKVYGSSRYDIDFRLDAAAKKLFSERYRNSYISVNDHPNTTFEDILAIIAEANV